MMAAWIALAVGGVVLVVALFVLLATAIVVDPGTIALVLRRGKATGRALSPGRHFVAPWQKVNLQIYPLTRNGVETDEARASAVFRIDGSRGYALATQIVAYDSATVSQYAAAVSADNERLQDFLRTTLVRPGFPPVFESWEAQIAAGRLPRI